SNAFSLSSSFSGTALEIMGTASGRILHAQDQLRSSGSLIVQTTGLFKGNLTSRGTISGAALTVMGGTSYFMGNVGIGTATPGAKLDVRTTGSITGLDIHVPDSAPYAMRIFNDTFSPSSPSFTAYASNDGAFFMGTTANANLSIYTNNAARMVYANDGRVAVGTATALNPNSHLNIWDGVATNTQLIVDGASGQTADIMKVTSASGGGLVFDANRMLKVARSTNNSATAPMTISVANTYLGLGGAEYSVDSYRLIGFGYVGASSYPAYIGYQEKTDAGYTNGDLIFGTRSLTSDTTPTERVRITSTGNLGIGTTSPDTKLEIIGTASGLILHAQDSLTSSGTLVWEGSASGASLWVSSFEGAGLTDCDASTQKVIWDDTLNKFSCATDLNTGSTYTAGQGLSLNGSNAFSLAASFSGTALEILGTASGKSLQFASGVFAATGATMVPLTVKGAASQTANLQEWQNSAGTLLTAVQPSGNLLLNANGSQREIVFRDQYSTDHVAVRLTTSNTFAFNADGSSATWGNGSVAGGHLFRLYPSNSDVGLSMLASSTPTSNMMEISANSGTRRFLIDNNFRMNIGSSQSAGARLQVESVEASTIGQIIKGAASQSANLQEWQNSAGTVLASIDKA
ncbi:MAG: hypothetical protein AAB544_03825, partial [Patescibacteria group bacterium]